MKHILTVLLMVILLATATSAQEKMSFTSSSEIPKSEVQTKVLAQKTIQVVNPRSLKAGQNYLHLKTGDFLFVDVKDRKIISLTFANARGIRQGSIITIPTTTQFQCSQRFCACSGDEDCNDMFTTNVCGPYAICFGDLCICYR